MNAVLRHADGAVTHWALAHCGPQPDFHRRDALLINLPIGIPVVMLTAHALNPETLKKSIELGARAYLPKEKLADIVLYLEDALTQEYPRSWGHMFQDLRGYFDTRFGERWMETDKRFWSQFENKIAGWRNIKLS